MYVLCVEQKDISQSQSKNDDAAGIIAAALSQLHMPNRWTLEQKPGFGGPQKSHRGEGRGHGGPGAGQDGRPPHHHHKRGRGGGRGLGGPASMRLLLLVSRAEESLNIGEIAVQVGVDQPRASRLVAQAVEQGLLSREADPADARRINIVLTSEGRSAAEKVLNARKRRVELALGTFTDAEQAQLAELLTRLVSAWEE